MSDFFAAVATSSGHEPSEVREVLEGQGVQPWVAPASSRPMLIQEVAFEGTKSDGDAFEFKWVLGAGVWALSSVDNDVGKSTVLLVIRWLLSGRDHVNKKTRAMIKLARLRFSIGDEEIAVEVQGDRGEETGSVALGGTDQSITNASFEATMDAIMLERLGLRPIARWQKFPNSDDGQATARGWTAFIPALFLPAPSSSAVLGDTAIESSTLLQVFLGLPWVSTSRQIDVALKQAAMEDRDLKRRSARETARNSKAAQQAALRVEAAEKQLEALPNLDQVEEELQAAANAVAAATRQQLLTQRILATRKEELEDAERALVLAKRSAKVLEETEVAGSIFSELKADVCPRCELDIGKDRRQNEAEQNICMVCGRTHAPAEVDAKQAISAAREKVVETAEFETNAKSAVSEASGSFSSAQAELQTAEARLRKAASASDALKDQQRARDELAEARGEVAAFDRIVQAPPPDLPSRPEVEILNAAKKEADNRIADTNLFEHLNKEILAVAHRFGMTDVDAVSINRSSNLPVFKGEVKESFSELSPSEKLRLRIATVIALLRVTNVGGPGRHPGLLVIDSPAAEEVADLNLDHILAELVKLASENPRLQVLVATTRTTAVDEAIEPGHTLFVPAGQFLW